ILRADVARGAFGVSGAGVKVGVMSGGVAHISNSISSGDISPAVQILNAGDPTDDEGTAMLEVVHDLAPGASLAFYGPNTSAEMVTGIGALASAGARVIVDDKVFWDQPKFEDGMIAQAARNFATEGRLYVTSANNYALQHYRAQYN